MLASMFLRVSWKLFASLFCMRSNVTECSLFGKEAAKGLLPKVSSGIPVADALSK